MDIPHAIGQIGTISQQIIDLLKLDIEENTPIFIGETNINHIISKHKSDYDKYGASIKDILTFPDFVGINKTDDSIEFVKEFNVDNEFVKVAVRVTTNNKHFVRSLYILNINRVNNFIKKGTLKQVKPLTNQGE